MKTLLPLLLCLSLSFFTVARATKLVHTPAAGAKTVQKPTGHEADAETLLNDASKALAAMIKAARADKGLDSDTARNKPFWKSYTEDESFDISDAEQEEVAAEVDTDQEVASADSDSMEDASDDEGEHMNDGDDGEGDAGDEGISDDDGGNDDGADDGGGDDNSGN